MAKVNPRVDFFQFQAGDEELTTAELKKLSLFEGLAKKNVPAFDKYPGSTVLRKCPPRRVLCNQGESGASAFYILSTEDVKSLRIEQIAILTSILEGAGTQVEHPRFSRLSRPEQLALKARFEAEVMELSKRLETIQSAPTPEVRDELRTVAKVKLFISDSEYRPQVGLLQKIAAWFRRSSRVEKRSQEFIPIDSMISLDAKTLESGLQEKEVFGEMSCQGGALRSATVFATQPCYMLEFLRNILDMLDEDETYRKKSDEVYRQRVLDKQIRRLSVFKDLSDDEFQQLRPRLDLDRFHAGTIIFDEHDESDCLYLVRRGLVKVLKHTSAILSQSERQRIDWGRIQVEFQTAMQSAAQLERDRLNLAPKYPAVAGTMPKIPREQFDFKRRLRERADTLLKHEAYVSSPAAKILSLLPQELKQALANLTPDTTPSSEAAVRIFSGFNDFIRGSDAGRQRIQFQWSMPVEFSEQYLGLSRELWDSFRDEKRNLLAYLVSNKLIGIAEELPESLERWSHYDIPSRIFRRELLQQLFPLGLPQRQPRPTQVLNYLGKGELLGELGFFSGEPRSATCIVFDQRNRGQSSTNPELAKLDQEAAPSRVDLVKVKASDLKDFSFTFRKNLEEAYRKRKSRLTEQAHLEFGNAQVLQSEVPEYEHLGLVQGQHLMLVDLEKCTRCGACVEACVESHEDRRTRLYLDGPRIDKYLIPITCRSCLDPVCLIGCPVGAIYRGDNDEIRIRNHCIGCATCTDQCPYGSIHRSEFAVAKPLLEFDLDPVRNSGQHSVKPGHAASTVAATPLKLETARRAVVCDLCSSTPSGSPACVHVCPHDAALRVNSREFFSRTDLR